MNIWCCRTLRTATAASTFPTRTTPTWSPSCPIKQDSSSPLRGYREGYWIPLFKLGLSSPDHWRRHRCRVWSNAAQVLGGGHQLGLQSREQTSRPGKRPGEAVATSRWIPGAPHPLKTKGTSTFTLRLTMTGSLSSWQGWEIMWRSCSGVAG